MCFHQLKGRGYNKNCVLYPSTAFDVMKTIVFCYNYRPVYHYTTEPNTLL